MTSSEAVALMAICIYNQYLADFWFLTHHR